MKRQAHISADGRYRYALWRTWSPNDGRVCFVCLNPSTADTTVDDPTLRRCINYARSWGYGSLSIANLFALRATDPRELKKVVDPIGPENDQWIERLTEDASLVVAAWGTRGVLHGRATEVVKKCRGWHVLDVSAAGHPRHPLYARRELQARPWNL